MFQAIPGCCSYDASSLTIPSSDLLNYCKGFQFQAVLFFVFQVLENFNGEFLIDKQRTGPNKIDMPGMFSRSF